MRASEGAHGPARVGVTHHAVARWAERRLGLDVDRLPDEDDRTLIERLRRDGVLDVERAERDIEAIARHGRRRPAALRKPPRGTYGPGPVREWRIEADDVVVPVVVDRDHPSREHVPTILLAGMRSARDANPGDSATMPATVLTTEAPAVTLAPMTRIYEPDRRDAPGNPRVGRKRHAPPSARVVLGDPPGAGRGVVQTTEQFVVAELFQSIEDHRRERYENRWVERRRALVQLAVALAVVCFGIVAADRLLPVVLRLASAYFSK